MEALLETVGLTGGELTRLIVLALILVIGLFLARVALKLTAALFRIGCFIVILIVAGVFLISALN